MPSKEGRTLHVYPPDHKGERIEPSFTSVLQAYYGAGLGDWSVVWERRAQPGDTILVHVGLYKPERFNYVDPMMAPFDGSMSLTLKGTKDKPITIKAAGDGEVIFDGDGNAAIVRRHGVEPSHLRRAHVSQHRRRHLRRVRKKCWGPSALR